MAAATSRAPLRGEPAVYRSPEAGDRVRAAELERELRSAEADVAALEAELDRTEDEGRRLADRLADSGPGAGEADPRRDRVGLTSLLLAAGGLPLAFLHISWHAHLAAHLAVAPAVLLMGAPGAAAAAVAWPHVTRSLACRTGFLLGALLAATALVGALFGSFT